MLFYFEIYYNNTTSKLSKRITFSIMISILFTLFLYIYVSPDGHHLPIFETYCLESEFPRMIDQYINHIEDSLNAVVHEDINILRDQQDFCYEQSQINTHLLALLPYASSHSTDGSNLLLTFMDSVIDRSFYTNFYLFAFFIIMITSPVIMKSIDQLETKRPKARRDFTRVIRDNVLKRQNYKCGHCRRILNAVDFHHKNGDRSDNRERNCQALCPNCHAIETRGLIK
jgi:hypothetical protein